MNPMQNCLISRWLADEEQAAAGLPLGTQQDLHACRGGKGASAAAVEALPISMLTAGT